MDSIIQWNCRGLKANFDEIGILISQEQIQILCLQETFLKPSDSLQIRNYHTYHTYGNIVHGRAFGGSSILIKSGIIHSFIKLQSTLQAIAARITTHKTFTVCSLYISPNTQITLNELNNLYNQLPSPSIILGDFNAHNPIWGSAQMNNRGKIIEEFINTNNLCILNDGSNTYLHPGYGTYSVLDLSITDPSLLLDFKWKVLDDTHGSDHYPILLSYIRPKPQTLFQKWRFNKADWENFTHLCLLEITKEKYDILNEPVTSFTTDLIKIANKTIPKSKTHPKHPPKPWFDTEVQEAIKNRQKALRKISKYPTTENLNNFKVLRAKTRRIIRQKKRNTWRNYISKLNNRTPSSKVWKMIKKIQGGEYQNVHHLVIDDQEFTTTEEIASKLAQQFSFNSSSDNYSNEFNIFKHRAEQNNLNFQSKNKENYNIPLTIQELQNAIKKASDSATGPDEIHYQLLKHLPEPSQIALLSIFNKIWDTGILPPTWKIATIIPIPKSKKDHSDPANYRPIALTSCLCKTMERIINDRLMWYLESNDLITDHQSGFRNKRSTTDHLVSLETYIRDAFISREHVVAIFFDLEKAYDTTWKFGIMKDLHEMGLRGKLPTFINSFLNNRWFKVRVGTTLSDPHLQENGVPQGSVLSPTCFNMKINSIVKYIKDNTMCSLYVDDFLIAYRSKHMTTIERQLQLNLNNLQRWSQENGFKFSKSKTVCIHFCHLRRLHPDPTLFIDKTPIKVVDQHKFLGVIFDSKLSFIPHITALKTKCSKSLNILKVVSKLKWGGDTTILLRLYRAITRSRLDYGSIVYGSARPSYLKSLNTIHHQGLRLSLGAFRTSPIESLYILANETSLTLRRIKLSLQYRAKLAACPLNPTYLPVMHPALSRLYESKPNSIRPLGLRIQSYCISTQIEKHQITEIEVPDLPPWILKTPKIIMKLAELKKKETNTLEYLSAFNEIRSQHLNHKFLYTDGSRMLHRTAFAVTSKKTNYYNERIPDTSSIFTAELTAIYTATKIAIDSDTDNFIICSDSKSALQALVNHSFKHPLVLNTITLLSKLNHEKNITYCWIPSHIGIKGNETADYFAKQALNKDITEYPVPYTDFKEPINDFITKSWQIQWDSCENNKLHTITPTVRKISHLTTTSRRDETVFHRILIGHSRITHSYLLTADQAPICPNCSNYLTIKHILNECPALQSIRSFQSQSLHHLFKNTSPETILNFLRKSNFYNLI